MPDNSSYSLSLVIQNASGSIIPNEPEMLTWATLALNAMPTEGNLSKMPEEVRVQAQEMEVTIRIIDKNESQDLNHQYRDKNKPTNVLSFPFDSPPGIYIPILGDLAICADIVTEESIAQKKSAQEHWAHMVVHGILHLRGFDHINNDDALIMESMETHLLTQLGFSAPYE